MIDPKKKIKNFFLKEEAPTVSAGSGAIAGIGVGPDGEPGMTLAQMKKYKLDNYKYYDSFADYLELQKKMEELAKYESEDFDEPEVIKASDKFHNLNNLDVQLRIAKMMRRK